VITAADMLRLARDGDLGCQRVIADAGRAIGRAVADLLNVLNPELIVVGGELAAAGDLLLDGVRESINRAALPAAAGSARLVAGILGDRAQVLGAVALVVSEADRTLLPESIARPIRRRR
jgi:predicted NBD/HSP70 family sugar kinase